MIRFRWLWVIVAAPVAAAQGVAAQGVAAQGAHLRGEIVDAITGRALPGAVVELRAARGADTVAVAMATTDRDGRVLLASPTPGEFVGGARLVGYRPSRPAVWTLTVGDTAVARILLEPIRLIDPLVTSVSRVDEPARTAPASVTVVDSRQLEESPRVTPVEQIRDAPGVDIATTGIMQHHVATRGFNGVFSGALLVLTDHRYDAVPGLRVNAPWLVPTPASDIDRVEVVLGPAAALYGPNAVAGVLHLITKSPFEWPGTTISVAGLARGGNTAGPAGSGGQLSLRHAGQVGGWLGYKATVQHLSGTDWSERDTVEDRARAALLANGTEPGAIRIGARDFGVSRTSAEGELALRTQGGSSMTIGVGGVRAGNAIELTGVGAAQIRGWQTRYAQLRARSGNWFAQLFGTANDAGRTFLLRSGDSIVDRSRMLVGQLQHRREIGSRQTLTYGIDGQRTEPRTGGTIHGRNESDDIVTEVGAYLQSESHPVPWFDLIATLRADRNDRLPRAVLSPRLALIARPTDAHNIRLTYNRAFETPTVQNLFSDIGITTPLPFVVRSIGVPAAGLTFRRDCGLAAAGLCMRSPYAASPASALPIDATPLWPQIVALTRQLSGADLAGIPAPSASDVATVLRRVDIAGLPPRFHDVMPAAVEDIAPLRPMRTEVIELGYKGEVGSLRVVGDLYHERRADFIAPADVATPSVFLDAGTLEPYLARYVGADQARDVALLIGGTAGSEINPGIPLGTVAPEGAFGGSPDVLVTFRNAGSLRRWGGDLGAQWRFDEATTVSAAWSWADRDFWSRNDVGGAVDIALNAPRHRTSMAVQSRHRDLGLSAYLLARYATGFPMRAGIYSGRVADHASVDLGGAYRLRTQRDLIVTMGVQNVLDRRHRAFVGAPAVGRLVMVQVEHTFSR